MTRRSWDMCLAVCELAAWTHMHYYPAASWIEHLSNWGICWSLGHNMSCRFSLQTEFFSLRFCFLAWFSRDEESAVCHGQIASLAVLRTHRKLGLATKLMKSAGVSPSTLASPSWLFFPQGSTDLFVASRNSQLIHFKLYDAGISAALLLLVYIITVPQEHKLRG